MALRVKGSTTSSSARAWWCEQDWGSTTRGARIVWLRGQTARCWPGPFGRHPRLPHSDRPLPSCHHGQVPCPRALFTSCGKSTWEDPMLHAPTILRSYWMQPLPHQCRCVHPSPNVAVSSLGQPVRQNRFGVLSPVISVSPAHTAVHRCSCGPRWGARGHQPFICF